MQKQNVLMIEGTFPITMKEDVAHFNAAAKEILKGIHPRTAVVKLSCKIGVGEKYEEITDLTTIDAPEKKTSIPHKRGQALLIDLWATWCPPCQKPMAHNQEMLAHRGADWGDKVRIIGISIDDSADTVASHVTKNGWTKVEHYHQADSDASEKYGSGGVPHVFLVDNEGTVVFKGHPATRDLEKDIDALIKGEKLTGKGTTPSGAEEDDEDGEEFMDLDLATVNKEMNYFTSHIDEVATALGSKASKLIKDMVVMVKISKYDVKTGKFLTNFQNVNVLVGQKADTESVLPEIESFMKKVGSTFKQSNRVQAL